MSLHSDIAAYSADGKLQLVVQIKGMANTDAVWATQYRRNLLAHQVVPASPYFLLVASDHMYLWINPAAMSEETPNAQGDTKAILARYLPAHRASFIDSSLEMAIQWWLSELTSHPDTNPRNDDEKRLLEDTGLLDKIRVGSLTLEVAE